MKSMYKVVVFEDDDLPGNNCVAQIYDPNLNAWSNRSIILVSENFGYFMLSDWANLNGVLYRVVRLGPHIDLGPPSDLLAAKSRRRRSNEMTWGLLAFHLNEGTFEILQMGQIDLPVYKDNVNLAVCNGSLLVLVYDAPSPGVAKGLIVLKINLESRRWFEMTRSTFEPGFEIFQKPATDGNSMFFVGVKVASGVLVYDVQEDEWSPFPCPVEVQAWSNIPRSLHRVYNAPTMGYQWYPFFFQPGLNPFGAV